MKLDGPDSLELDILNFLYDNAKTPELLAEMLNYEDEDTLPLEEYATEDAVRDCLVGLYSQDLVHGS